MEQELYVNKHVYDIAVGQRDAALAQLAAVTQQRDALRKALEAVEWFGGLGDVCPLCRQHKPRGHTADCQLAAALALVRDA